MQLLGHGNPFHEPPTNSYCADVGSRGSLELGSEDRRLLSATWFITCYVSLCGLTLCGLAVVASKHFLFTITALTVDRAALAGHTFYELTCWKGGIL